MNQLDLQGRHAVITGGAVGLGFAIAQRMLASGAQVTLWDRNAQALEDARSRLGDGVATVLVDVADHASVVAAVVAWLSTEDCAFSTGAVFDLSGGRSSY